MMARLEENLDLFLFSQPNYFTLKSFKTLSSQTACKRSSPKSYIELTLPGSVITGRFYRRETGFKKKLTFPFPPTRDGSASSPSSPLTAWFTQPAWARPTRALAGSVFHLELTGLPIGTRSSSRVTTWPPRW